MPDTGFDADRLIARRAPIPAFGAAEVRTMGPAGKRLGLLLGAVLLLLAGSIALVTWQDHGATLEEGWAGVERAALGASGHAERSIGAAALVTERVADIVRREGTATLRGAGHEQLAGILRFAPMVGSLWIMDGAGELQANSLEADPPAANFADRPFFAPLVAGSASELGPMLFGRVSRIWFFSYNRAVRDADGRLVDVVQAAMHDHEFERLHRALGLGPNGRIGLFKRSDGATLMLHPLPPVAEVDTPPTMPGAPGEAILGAVAAGAREGRRELAGPDGESLLLAWRVDARDGEVIAVATLPREEALAPFRARLARNAIAAALATLLVIGLGGAVAAAQARGAESRRAAQAGRRELLAVLEATGDLVVVADQNWTITFINSRGALSLAEGQDLTGRLWRNALPQLAGPIQRACELAMLARCRAEAEAELPGGRRFRAESHPREDGGIVVFLRDVTEARAAAARIAESEARLRMAVEATGLGTWDEDLVNGAEVWNERAFAILGLPSNSERITPETWRTLVHPDDLPRVAAAREAARRDGTIYRCEHRIIRADGALRWVDPLGRFLRDAEGRVVRFVGVFSDVTERKAAEAALAESEARLRRVLDSLFAFVGVLTPQGTVVEVNRAPLEATGLTLDEVRGERFWDCAWWTHDEAMQARVRHACARAAHGEASRFDATIRGAGDQRMIIDFQIEPLRDAEGRITHLIPSATDITARAAAEAALAESEGRFRLAQEAAEIGVFELVLPGPAHWSPTMFRLYGLDPGNRGPWMDEAEQLAFILPEERAAHATRRLAMRADAGQTRFAFEFRIRRADTGEIRWIASRGEVVRDASGRARVLRGINQDVTERRRAEERQMLLAREVDHRAKNALAVVQSIVALTRDADPARFRAAVIGRIAAMARAHTLLAREGWRAAELRELVEAEVAPHVAGAPGAPDRMSVTGPDVALQPDAAQPLAMAIHELATNAAKYGALSRPEGRVEIAWEAPDDGGLVLRWTERGGPELDGPPARRGFGSSVVRNTVERQLGGAVSFFWQREGLECTLALPPGQLRGRGAVRARS